MSGVRSVPRLPLPFRNYLRPRVKTAPGALTPAPRELGLRGNAPDIPIAAYFL